MRLRGYDHVDGAFIENDGDLSHVEVEKYVHSGFWMLRKYVGGKMLHVEDLKAGTIVYSSQMK